jgi:CheY-like chemotaxis protein
VKTKVLWVEDSARLELRNLLSPVYISGDYDLSLSEDATDATRKLQTNIYDAIILDMRLPPGADEHWIKIYRERGEDKASARLGLELANWMFTGHPLPYPPPGWIKPHQVAVFTVEDDPALHAQLESLKIGIYEHKTAGISDTILIDIIERIKWQRAPWTGK